jgi:ribosome maturation factor RimP
MDFLSDDAHSVLNPIEMVRAFRGSKGVTSQDLFLESLAFPPKRDDSKIKFYLHPPINCDIRYLNYWSAEKAGCLPAFLLMTNCLRLKIMIHQEIVDRVRSIADSILSHEEMELVEVEYRREARGWVLRLYIDREGGVTLDDCSRISQEVGRSLDVEDFILTPYTLEVSSPGLTRPLKGERDFIKYRNRLIKVRTFKPVEDRRHFKGKLLRVSEYQIEIEMEGKVFKIPLSNIAKANLEIDWNGPRHPRLTRGGKGRKLSTLPATGIPKEDIK